MKPSQTQLNALIGRRARYRGRELQVVEVLMEDGPSVVLQEPAAARTIQANQFGEANRRVPETWSIPVLAANGRDLHPLFRELDLL